MAVIRSIPTRAEQLALESTVSDRDRADLRRGARLFDAQRFWEAHEQWEEIWQREHRPIRVFYQGLIQVAAGYHHWTVTQRPNGVRLSMRKGVEKLSWFRPTYFGVDVGALIADADRMRVLADGKDAEWLAAFSRNDLPTFRWVAGER